MYDPPVHILRKLCVRELLDEKRFDELCIDFLQMSGRVILCWVCVDILYT